VEICSGFWFDRDCGIRDLVRAWEEWFPPVSRQPFLIYESVHFAHFQVVLQILQFHGIEVEMWGSVSNGEGRFHRL